MSQRVLISGYYGFNNMGDEVVLAGLLAGMQQVAPQVQPVVLSSSPAVTSALHGVESVLRTQVGSVWQALRTSAGLISGGGSLLQDVTSKRSVYYYLGVMIMAQLAGRPFCICGQGMGPLRSPLARKITGRVLSRARSIWVRDHTAGELVQTLLGRRVTPHNLAAGESVAAHTDTGNSVPMYIAADPAFLLPAPNGEQARLALQEAIPREIGGAGPFWLVAMRPWQDDRWQPYMVQALVQAAKAADACLGFVALHPSQDAPLAEQLHQEVQMRGVRSWVVAGVDLHQMRSLLAGADLVIAMRLHALILAAAAGVPGVAVSYDPKVTAFAQELALPHLFLQQLHPTGAADMARNILQTWSQQTALRKQLKQTVAEHHRYARQALALSMTSLGLPTAGEVSAMDFEC